MKAERISENRTRSLLLLDADPDERRLVSAIAGRAGWSVVGAACGETAVGLLQGPHGREVQAALLGSWDADTGPELIACSARAAKTCRSSSSPTANPVAVAVEAMRAGATDFLSRPVVQERLLEALAANSDRRRAAGELAPVTEKLAPELSLEQLVGAAPDFRATLAVAAKAARNRLPILIVGEPGTGKETFARAIHAASLRARGPLVTVDCKAIPANIIDSELFGHEKGAFPGRVRRQDRQDRRGRRRHAAARRDRRAARRNPAIARSRARHRRGPAGRLQRQQFGRRPRDRDRRAARCPRFRPGLAERIGATVVTLPRCATAAATSRRSPAICSPASPTRPRCASCRSAMTRWRC